MDNQRLDTVRALVANMADLHRAACALLKVQRCQPYLRLAMWSDPLPLDWLAEHGNHKIKAISDYGQIDGDCYKQVQCGVCLHVERCRRPEGHEGVCSSKVVKE